MPQRRALDQAAVGDRRIALLTNDADTDAATAGDKAGDRAAVVDLAREAGTTRPRRRWRRIVACAWHAR